MLNTILGSKTKMSQTFVDNTRVPVSVVKAGPCIVTQVKSMERDGYFAVQLGFGEKKVKNTTKPLQGHLKGAIKDLTAQAGNKAPHFLREVRLSDEPTEKVGEILKVADVFAVGDTIEVTGTSKGKGFAGGIKRHGFRGGSKTHGQSDRHRAPGSIGQGTNPGRVWKGKRMAGRMGNETVTIKNLKVVGLNNDKNELWISGPVPGSFGKLLIVKRTSDKQEPKVEPETNENEQN